MTGTLNEQGEEMRSAYIYIFLSIALFIFVLLTIGIIAINVYLKKRGNKKLIKKLSICMCLNILVSITLLLWLMSHRNYPEINDWSFLGKNIDQIEEEYGEFVFVQRNSNKSGYAIIDTSKIVDHHIELSCQNYRMDFNSNGTITSVNCQRPLGG